MESLDCLSSSFQSCQPASCHWRCALSVIDDLLRVPQSTTGEEADLLLDLRWHLRQKRDPEAALRIFCDLRRRMEQRHYLAFFRIRRWLENHLWARIQLGQAERPQFAAVRLNHYCVEAIRRVCLCSVRGYGTATAAPRLEFEFRPESPVAAPKPGAIESLA